VNGYLDADPLLRRAEVLGGQPTQRAIEVTKRLTTVFGQKGHRFAATAVTMIEVHTNFGKWVRQTELTHKQFDDKWFDAAFEQLMTDVKSGQVEILPLPPKVFETAIMHVTTASLELGRNLRGWDAVHVVCASAWSRLLGERVTLLTGDRPVREFVVTFPEFGQWIDIVDPAAL
jgi:hypothetical protein